MAEATEALVVDASVAIKWHLTDEDHSDQALALLSRFAHGQARLTAPAPIRYEVPSAITAATLGQSARLTRDQAQEVIAEFLALAVPTDGGDEIIEEAFPLAEQYGIAFYDALYLALSLRLFVPFITADWRLYRRVHRLSNVVWIGDYSGPFASAGTPPPERGRQP